MSDVQAKPTCGVVMPISAIDGCSPEHWLDVLTILKESAESAGFETFLVSDSEESGIIQKRIVQNLYECDIIVCDVSGKNPNVMFELGMRLAFDKPTIIVKDNKTDYVFDTSPVEHLAYPRDLRYSKILEFKESLARKLKSASTGSNAHSFLKSFGSFETVSIESKEISAQQFILSSLDELRNDIKRISIEMRQKSQTFAPSNTEADRLWRESVEEIAGALAKTDEADREQFLSGLLSVYPEIFMTAVGEALMRMGQFKLAAHVILNAEKQKPKERKKGHLQTEKSTSS